MLQSQDRELGKIVSRSKKGVGTSTLGNALSIEFTFDMDRLLTDVTDWVTRATKVESQVFGGQPVIRRFVRCETVHAPASDDAKPQRRHRA